MSENDRKKEYLKSYQKAVRREQKILDEIQQLRMDKMFPSVVNDGMPKSNKYSDLAEYVAKVDELIEKLKNERFEKIKLMDDILYHISLLEDKDEQRVLKLRYIKGLKWKEIEEALGYSHRSVHRLYNKSLQHLIIA